MRVGMNKAICSGEKYSDCVIGTRHSKRKKYNLKQNTKKKKAKLNKRKKKTMTFE